MKNLVKRLRYLLDNSAELEDKEALKIAIEALNSVAWNDKLYKAYLNIQGLDVSDPDFVTKYEEGVKDLQYPEYEFVPCSFRKLLQRLGTELENKDDITSFNFNNSILDKPLHILEDDGMGYGAHNAYAFCSDISADKSGIDEARIWI